jgi:GNAT superfamily N-acetyltransferase
MVERKENCNKEKNNKEKSDKEKIVGNIRLLYSGDIAEIVESFKQLGWHKPRSLYEQYLREQEQGKRFVWVAFSNAVFAGYVTLLLDSRYGLFKEQGIPEIVDLNVLPQFRKCGIGSALLDQAEAKALTIGKQIGIGCGLTEDYGAAQRLYVKRGYIPDGKGITHDFKRLQYGDKACVDDDLNLWLILITTS